MLYLTCQLHIAITKLKKLYERTNHSAINVFKRNTHKQRGVSAVEMALLLPILLLILDAILEFGLILHNQSVLTSATSMAARMGIVQSTPKLNDTQISNLAINYCSDRLISIGKATPPIITVLQSEEPSYPNPLKVTAEYTFKGLLVGGLISAFQSEPQLRATTVMYNE